MLEIADRIYLKLSINNVSLPDGSMAPREIMLHSEAQGQLPLSSLSFSDPTDVLGKNAITLLDGSLIAITLGTSSENAKTYNFRLFTPKRHALSSGFEYKITGYLDAPILIYGSDTASYKGSSSSVLSTIAKTCGLKSSVVATNDSQIWYQANRRYGEFIDYVSEHGYISDKSLMCCGISLDGTLKYVDYNAINFSNAAKLSYTPHGGTQVIITQHRILDNFGLNNAMRGYKLKTVEQRLDENNLYYTDTSLKLNTTTSQLNNKIQKLINRGRVEFTPFNIAGVVHDNYFKAYHQNMRGYALNASGMVVLSPMVTGLSLFDPVHVNLSGNFGKTDPSSFSDVYNGGYVVVGKQIVTKAGNYAEKLFLNRTGINT